MTNAIMGQMLQAGIDGLERLMDTLPEPYGSAFRAVEAAKANPTIETIVAAVEALEPAIAALVALIEQSKAAPQPAAAAGETQ